MHTWPFACPPPFAHKTGVFFLNIRVPKDLVAKIRSTRIALPVDAALVTIAVTDKVFLSLKTKDPILARVRFAAAYAALVRHFEAVRAGPRPLTHKQLVALAGEAYRHRADWVENDPAHGPHVLDREARMEHEAIAEWRQGGGDGLGEMDEAAAHFFAALQRPYGPQLIALELGRDLDTPYVRMTLAQALEDLCGSIADRLLAQHALLVDTETRAKLLREIAIAMDLVGKKIAANAEGDYSVDHAARFPTFVEPIVIPVPAPSLAGRKSITGLIERWAAYHADKRAKSTIRRYAPSLNSFARFAKDKDVRLVTGDEVRAWAKYRRDHDGISAGTVNTNDLVAVLAMFTFAGTEEGGKLRLDNPARGIKLDRPKKTGSIDKTFTDREVGDILRLARSVRPQRAYARASASRRWVPFICAYTGARVQEVCWLSREDIKLRDDIWVVHFPQTKEGIRRWVVLHDALLNEGLLDFWRHAPDGPLFTGDRPQVAGASRSAAEQRASELSAWIRKNVQLESDVSPSHSWRHTFITNAEDIGIAKRMVNAITGHNRRRDASDGYYTPKTRTMQEALKRYPCYNML